MIIKVFLLALFFAMTVGVGVFCRKHTASVGDFVLGGRNVGPWVTAFAYGTSYFSAVIFVGYAGQFGWAYGMSATWIGIGNALIGSLLAWVVLGRRTRIMTKHFESATMPDFFAKRYQSESLRVIVSVIIFIFLVPYSASVYKGLSGLFAMAFGINFAYCMIGMAILTAVYVMVGGYMAAALNDLIQGTIMLLGIVAVIWMTLHSQGGLMGAMVGMSKIENVSNPAFKGAYTSFFGPDPIGLLSVVLLTSLGTWGLPQMVHKFYTIKNEKAIKTGTIISTLFALVVAGGSYFHGSFGRLFIRANADGSVAFDEIVPTMIGNNLPDVLIGVVVILVLSASMSTLSSLVIASSSTFTLDFLKPLFFKNMDSKMQILFIRVLCGLFVLISVLIALRPNQLITSLMSLSWGTLAGCFLGPFIYGLFWKGSTRLSVFAAFLSGIGINVSNLFLHFTTPVIAGAGSMLLSLLIVPLISFMTPKLSASFVEETFACYDEKVMAAHKMVLNEDEDQQ
ncbi:sodium:solute symporter family transporter [Sinanaerobacter sp. ZZT-01]|uniref:sodium:solute symporter family transporter n=1 Tax=Sinanaerobacter sp. ZZT-01 TaxID=3111540 RepID=UPI002D78594C|nr:sodium:solute symporter [Sinanaerobacter sp. ZZT-01]WRR94566.1 sodium:solute symporter [Sinanaerobacter sp. ZZT-01]